MNILLISLGSHGRCCVLLLLLVAACAALSVGTQRILELLRRVALTRAERSF